MRERTGDMFMQLYAPNTLIVVTANSTVTQRGKLVMGTGAAKRAVKVYGALMAFLAGKAVEQHSTNTVFGLRYGFLRVSQRFGIFQVKYHYKQRAGTDLIRLSAHMLREFADAYTQTQVHLNFPGIGDGKLPEELVRPILEEAFRDAENITVWKLPAS